MNFFNIYKEKKNIKRRIKMEKKYYIYRYFNDKHDIIYIGLTERPLKERVREHKVEELQKETAFIDYATVKTKADMEIYEIFYINKYLPKFNIKSADPERTTIQLPELDFKVYSNICADKENINGSYREYSFPSLEGRIIYHLNNPFAKAEKDKNIQINTMGKVYFSIEEYKDFLEKQIQILNDAKDEDMEAFLAFSNN